MIKKNHNKHKSWNASCVIKKNAYIITAAKDSDIVTCMVTVYCVIANLCAKKYDIYDKINNFRAVSLRDSIKKCHFIALLLVPMVCSMVAT